MNEETTDKARAFVLTLFVGLVLFVPLLAWSVPSDATTQRGNDHQWYTNHTDCGVTLHPSGTDVEYHLGDGVWLTATRPSQSFTFDSLWVLTYRRADNQRPHTLSGAGCATTTTEATTTTQETTTTWATTTSEASTTTSSEPPSSSTTTPEQTTTSTTVLSGSTTTTLPATTTTASVAPTTTTLPTTTQPDEPRSPAPDPDKPCDPGYHKDGAGGCFPDKEGG